MELLVLLFSLWAIYTWWEGNVSWYESHGWPVLLPLNLGIVWFFGFPYYFIRAYDIRPSWMGGKPLPLWQSALFALIWGGGMLLDQYWFNRAMEAGKRRKEKPDR